MCIDEGVRNAVSGGPRAAAWTLLVTAALIWTAVIDAQALQTLRTAERQQWQAGGSTILLEAEHGVDGTSCDLLNRQPAVAAAGGVRRTDDTVILQQRPDSPVALIEATWGAVRLSTLIGGSTVTSPPPTGQVLASPDTIASLGLRAADIYTTTTAPDRPLQLAAPADLSVSGAANTGLIALVPTDQAFDACIVQARPGKLDQARQLASTLLLAARPADSLDTVTVTAADPRNLVQEHRTRPTRWAWLASGLALGAIWTLIEAARRSQKGLYLTLGLDRVELCVVRTSELLVHVFIALTAAIPIATAWLQTVEIDADLTLAATLVPMLATTSLTVLSGLLSALLTPSSDVLAMVKDRG